MNKIIILAILLMVGWGTRYEIVQEVYANGATGKVEHVTWVYKYEDGLLMGIPVSYRTSIDQTTCDTIRRNREKAEAFIKSATTKIECDE